MIEFNFNDKYDDWIRKITSEVVDVQHLMEQPLSDEPRELESDIRRIEAKNDRCGMFLAQASTWLDRMKALHLTPKEGQTDFDRKITLDYKISRYRYVKERLEHLVDCVQSRISLGQSLLKRYREEGRL